MATYTSVLQPPKVIVSTLGRGQGVAGPPGPSGAASAAVPFAYGDATPATVIELEAGTRVFTIELAIHTAFNGTGASISVGTLADSERFLPAAQVDPSSVGIYEASPNEVISVDTEVLLFITPGLGASQGSGSVSIHRQ